MHTRVSHSVCGDELAGVGLLGPGAFLGYTSAFTNILPVFWLMAHACFTHKVIKYDFTLMSLSLLISEC